MDSQEKGSNLLFILLGLFIVYKTLVKRCGRTEINTHIPTFGYQGYLLSYIDAINFLFNGPTLLMAGYKKHRPGIFKISTLHRQLVVLTETQHIEALRVIPDDNPQTQTEADLRLYYAGHYRLPASRDGTLTRYLTQTLPFMVLDLREEVVKVLNDLPTTSMGWMETNALDLVLHAMTAINNRLFFSLSHAHDSEFKSMSILVAKESFHDQYSLVPDLLPSFHASLLSIFTQSSRIQRQFRKVFEGFVRERVNRSPVVGIDTLHRDILAWMTIGEWKDGLVSNLYSIHRVATDSLVLNFLHVLYHLSANPKYASPIRKEIEAVISTEGWSKASLDKMHKLDSFVKESLRISPIMSVNTIRRLQHDTTFSDGTHIPEGTFVCVASLPRQMDSRTYGHRPQSPATMFDGFRFSKLHEQLAEEYAAGADPRPNWPASPPSPYHSRYSSINSTDGSNDGSSITDSPPMNVHTQAQYGNSMAPRFQLATTGTDYLAWGYGPRACPGRFYASMVMKLVLAQVVMGYDVRFEDGHRPKDVCRGARNLPGRGVKILMRKRERSTVL